MPKKLPNFSRPSPSPQKLGTQTSFIMRERRSRSMMWIYTRNMHSPLLLNSNLCAVHISRAHIDKLMRKRFHTNEICLRWMDVERENSSKSVWDQVRLPIGKHSWWLNKPLHSKGPSREIKKKCKKSRSHTKKVFLCQLDIRHMRNFWVNIFDEAWEKEKLRFKPFAIFFFIFFASIA